MIAARDQLVICFAHAAYQMKACFDALNTGIASFEVRERDEFERRAPEADVIVVCGMWHNGLIPLATRLRFIQSIGSGTYQFDQGQLAARGIRLASAAGVNARAVAEHAMSLILALARRLPEERDHQARRVGRLAQLAKAFDMTVVGFRRTPPRGLGPRIRFTRWPNCRRSCRGPTSSC